MDEFTKLGLGNRKMSIGEELRECVCDLLLDLECVRDGVLDLEHLGNRLLYGKHVNR